MTPEEQAIFDTLTKYKQYFHLDDIASHPIRKIGWMIIKFLIGVVDGLQKAILEALDLTFMLEDNKLTILGMQFNLKDPSIQGLVTMFVPVTLGIAVCSTIFYLIRKLINKDKYSYQNLVDNLVLGFATILLSGAIITQALQVTREITKAVYSNDTDGSSYAYQIINRTGYDLRYLIEKGFNVTSGSDKLFLSPENIDYFDYSEVAKSKEEIKQQKEQEKKNEAEINKLIGDNRAEFDAIEKEIRDGIPEREKDQRKIEIYEKAKKELVKRHASDVGFDYSFDADVLSYRINIDQNGQPQLVKINDKKILWLDITQSYFRYGISYWGVLLFLAATCIALFVGAIKIVKLLYEILFTQTILPLFAFSDLYQATTLRSAIRNITNALLTIFMTALALRVYFIMLALIVQKNLEGYISFIFQLALALAVIDGPNIIQQITGYDAGIKSTTKTLAGAAIGAYAGARGLFKGLNGLGKAAGKLSKKGKERSGSSGRGYGEDENGPSSKRAKEREQYVQNSMKGLEKQAQQGQRALNSTMGENNLGQQGQKGQSETSKVARELNKINAMTNMNKLYQNSTRESRQRYVNGRMQRKEATSTPSASKRAHIEKTPKNSKYKQNR